MCKYNCFALAKNEYLITIVLKRWKRKKIVYKSLTLFISRAFFFTINYFFECARLYKSLFPHKNVTTPTPKRYFMVWNMFNWSQKSPKSPKMAPRPKWNPNALSVNGKFETLTLSFIQRINKRKRGKQTRTLNKLDTNLAGLLSGSRKRCCNEKKRENNFFISLWLSFLSVLDISIKVTFLRPICFKAYLYFWLGFV